MSGKKNLEAPAIRWLKEPGYEVDDHGEIHQVRSGLDFQGREYPDSVPMRPPPGLSVGTRDVLADQIRATVQAELFKAKVAQEGFETFEESEDFEIEDDNFPVDPRTPWEAVFDPPPTGGVPGNGQQLASEAVKMENRAPEDATPSPGINSSQRVSSGSSSELKSSEKTGQKPTGASDSSVRTGDGSEVQISPRSR